METLKNVLNAVAEWFTGAADATIVDSVGEFVKGLFDTIVNAIFPVS